MLLTEIKYNTSVNSMPWNTSKKVYHTTVYINHPVSYEEFFNKIFLGNRLCVIGSEATSGWTSRKVWVSQDGSPNFSYLQEHFGEAIVPVADCSAEEFCSHPKTEMKMADYMDYWQTLISQKYPEDAKCLYLKDWHFTREFPSYCVYNPPAYLCSDWMNEYWDLRENEDKPDDYRFVYMGPKGSWTPFHADVLKSYSWSANICGQKKWIFLPPGIEEKLKDRHGHLAFDLRSPDLRDPQKYPEALGALDEAITVIQNPGEIIYVPSGWYHQVFNMKDTISINHNWINGCSAHLSWKFIKSQLAVVQKEIADCEGMDGWNEQCQIILKADSGVDYIDFYNFMATIATHRLKALHQYIKEKSSNKANDSLPTNHQTSSNVSGGNADILENNNSGIKVSYCKADFYAKEDCSKPCDFNTNSFMCTEFQTNCEKAFVALNEQHSQENQKIESDKHSDKFTCISYSVNSEVPIDTSTSDCGNMCSQPVTDAWPSDLLCLYKSVVIQGSVSTRLPDHVKVKTDNVESVGGPQCVESLDTLAMKNEDHTSCPHWAHCGPNLALFDLLRVLDIVKDIKEQTEFKAFMENEVTCKKLLVPPKKLIDQIQDMETKCHLILSIGKQ